VVCPRTGSSRRVTKVNKENGNKSEKYINNYVNGYSVINIA